MFKVGVCEDQKIWQDYIEETIKNFFERKSEGVEIVPYYSGEELIQNYMEQDILIVDIDLPGMNGIQAAKIIRSIDLFVEIIFLTSHMEKMQDAFQVKAYRFLDKDFKYEPLVLCIEEIVQKKGMFFDVEIEEKNRKYKLNTIEIIMVEAIRNGTIIYCRKKTILSNKPLKFWEEKLKSKSFYRTHRSYVVHMNYILYVKEKIRLVNGYYAELSRRKKIEFSNVFFDYLGGFKNEK